MFNPLDMKFLPVPDEQRLLSVVRGENRNHPFNGKCIHGVDGAKYDQRQGRMIAPECKRCLLG